MTTSHSPVGSTFKRDLDGLANQAGVVKTEIGTLAHDAVGAARDGAAELREGAHQAVDAAKVKLSNASHSVKEKVDEAKDHAAEMANTMKDYVSEHPLASVGIALGVGIIAGIFLGRPRS